MNDYPKTIKSTLTSLINEISESPALFVTTPEKDFTRKRKLPMETVIQLLISMGGNSIYKELLESQGYDEKTATTSAFVQQREKILPWTFEFLLHEFTQSYSKIKTYRGYRLIAVDGSFLHIATNPEDSETYIQSKPDSRGYNLLQMNAMFDLCNKLYSDALVLPYRLQNEKKAIVDMVDRSRIKGDVIVIGDRAYESWNIFAHIERKGWNYMIRVRDVGKQGIPAGLKLPASDEFDVYIDKILTKKSTKEVKAKPDLYRIVPSTSTFDFLDLHDNKFYPISFRVVRFKISDDFYETVITNLKQDEFSSLKLKELYKMRWGVETSFRELKYAVGLNCLHSKKREYIIQEIFARIIMYNFAEMITSHVVVSHSNTKHIYQVNFTIAIHICRQFLRAWINAPPFDVEALIRKNILPVRPNRKGKRILRSKQSVSFIYRVA
jgi:hypothetical protein